MSLNPHLRLICAWGTEKQIRPARFIKLAWCFKVVRARGLEPPWGCPHTDLNRTRLPIPPRPQVLLRYHQKSVVDNTRLRGPVQEFFSGNVRMRLFPAQNGVSGLGKGGIGLVLLTATGLPSRAGEQGAPAFRRRRR